MTPTVDGKSGAIIELLGTRAYRRLRQVLREKEGFDLDAYRSAYLARRLRTRFSASGHPPREYPDVIARDDEERQALMEALGVNVTGFFRDPAVWQFLEDETLPPLLDARGESGEPVHVAALGCAGGQEAYGVAMLLMELTRGTGTRFEVDAFDVDPAALAVATTGAYPREALDPASEACRERYFQETAGGLMQLTPDVRYRVRVKRLDVLTDPLPRRYDVILCRNMMIYLDAPAKERLLLKIHTALAPDGILVLGQSEVLLGRAARAFRTLSPRHRVYRRGGLATS